MQCQHVINGGERCARDAATGADFCDLHRGYIPGEREELTRKLLRFNPFGGYCVQPCNHPGHTTEVYRQTVARIEVKRRG